MQSEALNEELKRKLAQNQLTIERNNALLSEKKLILDNYKAQVCHIHIYTLNYNSNQLFLIIINF